jgi:SpoVK/Ycf46/Vps4 family AAA+-type ATPase
MVLSLLLSHLLCAYPRGNFDLSSSNGTGDDSSSEAGVVARVLSTFLNELDGVTSASLLSPSSSPSSPNALNRVFVVAACSDAQTLDKALLRPGRLSHQITLFPPSRHDLRELFEYSISRVPVAEDVCSDRLVDLYCNQEGLEEDQFNSSHVIAICHQAIQLAVNENINQSLQREHGQETGTGEGLGEELRADEGIRKLQMHHFESILLPKQKKRAVAPAFLSTEFTFDTKTAFVFS